VARPSSSLPFDFSAPPEPPARPAAAEAPRALTVGELDRVIKRSLDASFESPVWVEGEVVGAKPAPAGHLYFSFKDEREDASIDVAIYKTNITPRLRAMIVNGAKLRLRGRPSFWAPRGRLQLVVDRGEPVGRGALLEALERLRARLAAEGLFDPSRKRVIPPSPRVIGVVTSRTGAVIHDVCKVAFRRGGADILLAPALVQGAGAATSIRRAILALSRVARVDVIIVGRGGGSSDDLSAFNEEEVVRAVAECSVPVISAVGHEVDFTLTDFAADARAATPSQAAEMVVPDQAAQKHAIAQARARIQRAMQARLADGARRLAVCQRDLGDPRLALASSQQTLDDLTMRLGAAVRRPLGARGDRVVSLERRLTRLHPSLRLAQESRQLSLLTGRMRARAHALLGEHERRLGELAASLDALSPLKVLGRGYAIATTEAGRAVRRAEDVAVGDALTVRVASGRVHTRVTSTEPDEGAQAGRGARG
jgi:exodeoxyribonuclease VII large subunit